MGPVCVSSSGWGLRLKLAGGLIGAACLAVLAAVAHLVFGEQGLGLPILVASLLPLVQAPEGVAAAVLVVRRRYDIRAGFLVLSMALRLAALALGAPRGVTAAVTAIVIAQVIATAAIGVAGWIAVRRYPEGRASRSLRTEAISAASWSSEHRLGAEPDAGIPERCWSAS